MESKKILITAGTVYGKLDANKLVGNRIRGIWASRFAAWLVEQGHDVTLLVADIQKAAITAQMITPVLAPRIVEHNGFWDYRDKVRELVPEMDAAVMAAAVVNWIPAEPYKGKMPTEDYTPGESRIDIPFLLAPRVIDDVKRIKPEITLIGCKMTAGVTLDQLTGAAYKTLLGARCNAVIANDLTGLREKFLVHQDRTRLQFAVDDPLFYPTLLQLMLDEHYRTVVGEMTVTPGEAVALFDRIVERYRGRFVHRFPESVTELTSYVFGAVAVRLHGPDAPAALHDEVLISPREKGQAFTSTDAVRVAKIDHEKREVHVSGGKATLNAPLLVRHLQAYPEARAVLHLHEQLQGVPTVSYAPPGTLRDHRRPIPASAYNIEGHGFIAALDENGELLL